MDTLARRIERNLGWIVLAILLFGCLLVLWPFVSALLWAVVLSFSTWPIYRRVLKGFGGRRTLAAAAMTLAMIVVILGPFVIIGTALAGSVKELASLVRHSLEAGLPPPPAWLSKVPLVGEQAVAHWQSLAADNAKLLHEAQRFIQPVTSWLLKIALALGAGLLELALSIFVAFFLFRDGLSAARRLVTGAQRIGGERGRRLLTVAGNTVRGVVYGILGTALVQAIVAGIGFVIAGVPGAALLALLTFFLSVVPLGPLLLWLPAAIWLFNQGSTGMGIFMLIWGVGVSSIDHVVRPWLISQGSDLPFILIFLGVFGGALVFGFIGVFLGPTLLAVGFRVLEEWFSAREGDAGDSMGRPVSASRQ